MEAQGFVPCASVFCNRPAVSYCILTALGSKRLAANGTMENVPPTEWLKLRAEVKPDASFASAVIRWILEWPKDRWAPPF
jgi:hypothetical protein